VETVQRSVQYRVHSGSLNDVELDCHGRSFHVPEISAKILAKIRDVASDFLGFKVGRAVVTVPAYFTDRQRQSVKEAGTLVDLEVVRIINEPTAAALAYGIGKRLKERVLVYDLGGGTFDVSIIEIRDRVFEVKATGGDIFLGGLDFDNAMIAHVLDEFRRKHGIDLSSDPVAMQRIKDLAERTKVDLSARTEAPFSIPFITMTPQGQPLNLDVRFDRKLLEALTQHLVDRSLKIMAGVMVDAGITAKEIDEVMPVGGQTRMPVIQERLTRFFGKPPSKGGELRPEGTAAGRDPDGDRDRAGRRHDACGLPAERGDPEREDRRRHQRSGPSDRARGPDLPGRPPRDGPERAARGIHLQRGPALPRR
jgi:molecular chaperone DnaK